MTTIAERRYRNKLTGFCGVVEWDDGHGVGIDCGGFTWTGTHKDFREQWEEA